MHGEIITQPVGLWEEGSESLYKDKWKWWWDPDDNKLYQYVDQVWKCY